MSSLGTGFMTKRLGWTVLVHTEWTKYVPNTIALLLSLIRLKKSKLLPVKCEECSFHYTTRSSLSKHIEKKRCSKNKEHVKYAEAKIEKRRLKKLKTAGLHESTKIEPIKLSGEVEVKSTQEVVVPESEEELKVKQTENKTEFRKIEIEMVKERINGPFFSPPIAYRQ